MDNQTVLLIGLGSLLAAGVVVSVGGWMLFARDRRGARAARTAAASGGGPGASSGPRPQDDAEPVDPEE